MIQRDDTAFERVSLPNTSYLLPVFVLTQNESKSTAVQPAGSLVTVASLLVTWLVVAFHPYSANAAAPNILIIMADDLAYRDVGCYGNQEVRTPNLDQLASEGMRFTQAFCATAMCSPCRQQLFTGLFPVRNGAYPNHSRVFDDIKSIVHDFQSLGYRVAISGKKHFGPTHVFPFESLPKQPSELRDRALADVFEMSDDRPFCLVYTSKSPHTPWTETDGGTYDWREITIPKDFVDTPETRQALAKYYGEVSSFDQEVGRCLKLLGQSQAAKNTIVVALSEQGCNFPGGKWTCYDLGLRCAMIIRWPGRVQANSTSDAMVQYVDILPTLIEACAGSVRSEFDGRSFLKVLDGESKQHHQYVFGVHTTRGIKDGNEAYPIRSVRDAKFKLIRNLNADATFQNVLTSQDQEGYWNSWLAAAENDMNAKRLVQRYLNRPPVELYDLENDPLELNNLATSEQYSAIVARLNEELTAWMKQQGDAGMATERRAFERQPKRNPAGASSRTP